MTTIRKYKGYKICKYKNKKYGVFSGVKCISWYYLNTLKETKLFINNI